MLNNKVTQPKRPRVIAGYGDKEASIQQAVFAYLAAVTVHGWEMARYWDAGGDLPAPVPGAPMAVYEAKWIHAIPNGAPLGGDGDNRGRSIRGAQMKAEGLKPGVCDIFWPLARNGYNGIYIELKTKVGKLSYLQEEFMNYASSNGFKCLVLRDYMSVINELENYFHNRNNNVIKTEGVPTWATN